MSEAITLSSTVQVSDDQISAHLGEDTVILELQSGIYYGLEGISPLVWNLIQEPRQVAEIRDRIVETYDVSSERCASDLLRVLGEMLNRKLIVIVGAETGDR